MASFLARINRIPHFKCSRAVLNQKALCLPNYPRSYSTVNESTCIEISGPNPDLQKPVIDILRERNLIADTTG